MRSAIVDQTRDREPLRPLQPASSSFAAWPRFSLMWSMFLRNDSSSQESGLLIEREVFGTIERE